MAAGPQIKGTVLVAGSVKSIFAGGALLLRDANGNLKRIVVGDIR